MAYSDTISVILLVAFAICIMVPMAMALCAMIDDHRREARHARRVRRIIRH